MTVFVDERGPQENIKKITEPFDKVNKLKYGDDDMHVYVADWVRIPEEVLSKIENVYKSLEEEYIKTRNFPEGRELKGAYILKNKFKYGVASLKKNELTFYSKLFELLIKYKIDNLLFSISKMSLLIDSKLSNWILDAGETKRYSSVLLKYTLTKYAEVEASEKVVKNLLDQSVNIESVLLSIEEDLSEIIRNNKENPRMRKQIETYKELLQLIQESHICNAEKSNASFNWEKVSYNVDLWITENKIKGNTPNNMTVVLDEGIPSYPFEKLNFHAIYDGNNSNNVIGLRIADMLVAIAGNYISKLSADNHYDFEKPSERKILSPEWFEINEEQFKLIINMNNFFLKGNQKYGFIVDTYFDDAILFETFLKYISSYSNFEEYKKISIVEHPNKHFRCAAEGMMHRWEEGQYGEMMAQKMCGSLKLAIKKGLYHQL